MRPAATRGCGADLEEAGARVVGALEDGVVDRDAVDASVGGQHPGLRLDLLGGEHALHRRQQRVAVEQLEIAGQLLAPVKGVFAAQEIKPQARVLAADRGIDCVTVDYAVLKGTDDPSARLF